LPEAGAAACRDCGQRSRLYDIVDKWAVMGRLATFNCCRLKLTRDELLNMVDGPVPDH